MNVLNASDDNDFPVFKAGPPLPVRAKGKPHFKTKSTAPLKATNSTVISTSQSTSKLNSSLSNAKSSSSSTINAESKVKQYIERVKASDELGRKKRLKPEQMLSLEDLYQVNLSKENANTNGQSNSNTYEDELSVVEVQEKLRETMRIVREKDELINKLRESCHDLAIKCADAENRVDELRFSYGRSLSTGKDVQKQQSLCLKGRGSVCGDQSISQVNDTCTPRRCASVDGLFTSNAGAEEKNDDFEKHAKADKVVEVVAKVNKQDAHTQVEPELCPDETFSEQEVGHWLQEELEDDILQETCSNWLEKVQNWKTDSNFNLSQDSGGDKDSGFRGSAEIDNESVRRQQRLLSSKSRRKSEEKVGEVSLTVPSSSTAQIPQMSSTSSTTIQSNLHHPKSNAVFLQEDEEHGKASHLNQHFWPSFTNSQSYFHLNHFASENLPSDSTKAKSLFYELAEAKRNKHEYFHEGFTARRDPSQQRSNRLHCAKSLDLLYFSQTAHHRTKEELRSLIDSSFDPPEFILKSHLNSQHRSIDKNVKMLDPLLDDATRIALRVKQKSERLAKMLQDACTFD